MAKQLSQAFTAYQPPRAEILPRDSSEELLRLDLARLPARLDDLTLAKLARLASSPLPQPAPCPEHTLMEVMTTLQSCLPSQQRNEISAEVQAEAYSQALSGHSFAAIKHLEGQALRHCDWFPTIAECKRILAGFTGDSHLPNKRASVQRRIMDERQARFDEAMDRLSRGLASQAEIDAMPERWKSVGETRAYLWRHEDGAYTARVRREAMA